MTLEMTDPSSNRPPLRLISGQGRRHDLQKSERRLESVSFDRRELNVIFNLYGAKVAAGEWRDYALDFTPAKAIFSVFRRASEAPLYRIEKNPDLARRQGPYAVIASGGLILRRGHDLSRVLSILDVGLRIVGAE